MLEWILLPLTLTFAEDLPDLTTTHLPEMKTSTPAPMGFYIGDVCETSCSELLLHAVCNNVTKRCECDSKYPIVIDKAVCVAPLRLGERCLYDQSCRQMDRHSVCAMLDDFTSECQCKAHFGFSSKPDPNAKAIICVPGDDLSSLDQTEPILNTDVPTIIGVGLGLGVFSALTCLVLHLFSRARFARPRGYANANLPPPVTLSESKPGFRSSRNLHYYTGSRTALNQDKASSITTYSSRTASDLQQSSRRSSAANGARANYYTSGSRHGHVASGRRMSNASVMSERTRSVCNSREILRSSQENCGSFRQPREKRRPRALASTSSLSASIEGVEDPLTSSPKSPVSTDVLVNIPDKCSLDQILEDKAVGSNF